jgi:flagellar basal body P-ring formation protein FlgA
MALAAFGGHYDAQITRILMPTASPRTRRAWMPLAALALPLLLLAGGAAASAQTIAASTSPAAIDRAVAAFTGAAIGTPGGARMASDSRLQLAPCTAPLAVSWHTPARTAVAVECPGPTPWRVFVAITPAPGSAPAARPAPAVKRGDAITILVRGRGFSVQQPGEAMEAGALGDWIEVRTSRKAQGVRARIERPGLVVVPAG